MSEKTHWKKAFDSDYLSSADIPEGKDLILTIKQVRLEDVKGSDGAKQKRNIAYFKENYKPMILNATNSKTVKKFAGSKYIDDWNNVPIQVYVDDNIKAFGDIVEGLRIRKEQPKGKKQLLFGSEQWQKAVEFLLTPNGSIEKIKKNYDLSKDDISQLENDVKKAKEAKQNEAQAS